MTIQDVVDLLDARVLCGEHLVDQTVLSACGADLMSDVLAYVKEKSVLLTGLINPHVVRTAEMLDVLVIVFVRGKLPTQEILDMAMERDIVVLTTPDTLYVACGLLYQSGLPGSERMKG
ncbi:hypothetical protein H8699_05950 [Christensenellaceae bacterium NSJ-44]|uniref:DRTGG domain-containing protein n=1 Tax=Luoshenia tenuis TaxID=2763654 RepID=A0A926HLY6_9FIRM|nr:MULTISPECIES: DRTGG domain-containing protein [Clostridia]MBC8528964.1 hypothetical protein [Luoshenia tenuis]